MDGTRGHRRLLVSAPGIASVTAGFGLLTVAELSAATALSVRGYEVGGALAVGFLGFRFVPAGLLSPFTAGLGDVPNPQRTMAACASLRSLLMVVAACGLAVGVPLAAILVLIGVDAMVATSYRPSQALLLPHLVRTPADLASSATLLSNSKSAGQVVGPLVGGLMAATVRTQVTFAGAAGLFLITALLALRAPVRGGERTGRRGVAAIVGTSLAAIRSLARHTDSLVIAELSGIRSLTRGMWMATAVVAALTTLGMGRSGVGILAAAAGAGTFAAIAFTGRFLARTRLTTAVVTSLACCALPLGLIGAIAKPVSAAVLIALWGAAMCLADAAIETLRTRVVAARTVLRTVGLIEGLKLLLEGLGALLAIGLISLLGVRDMLLALGAAVPVLAVVHIPLLRRVDARASARVHLVELVRGIGVFGRLRVVALERLAAALEPEEYNGGTTILRQGEADSRGIFLIDSGSVEVEVDGQPVRRLDPGASFGEIALVHDVPRTATVRSREQVSLWALDRDNAASALTGYWRSAPRGSDTKPHAQGAAVHALLSVPALGVIPRGTLERLTSEAERLEFDAGEIVVRVGDPGEHIYVVLEGTAEATATGSPPTFMGPGEVFGQIAVLSGVPRTATVRARSRLVLLAIDGRGLATPAPAPEPPRPRRS